ncbi:hypothetical protein, partial [Acinetobacter baumannii]|uniref:hypothetical protein n=1 Tax=Acinetobacter baumannii TaxID=470 RepID=UPI001488BA39
LAVFITPFLLIYALLPDRLSPLASVWIRMFAWLIPVAPKAWRQLCQQLAGIPAGALALRDMLATAPFQVGPDDMPSLQRKLSRIGYQ